MKRKTFLSMFLVAPFVGFLPKKEPVSAFAYGIESDFSEKPLTLEGEAGSYYG